jgi:hypothetical protein
VKIAHANALVVGCVVGSLVGGVVGCKEPPPKQTMTAEQVITAITDFADRGCVCETDKECFREVRDEWDAAKREIVKNARLLTGDDAQAYEAARMKFGHCGDGAGLAVFDKW